MSATSAQVNTFVISALGNGPHFVIPYCSMSLEKCLEIFNFCFSVKQKNTTPTLSMQKNQSQTISVEPKKLTYAKNVAGNMLLTTTKLIGTLPSLSTTSTFLRKWGFGIESRSLCNRRQVIGVVKRVEWFKIISLDLVLTLHTLK